MEISRKELFDQIWKIPRTVLAESWKVKVSEITEACKAHGIPLPASGHWTKVNMGYEVKLPLLSGDLNTPIKIILASTKLKIKTKLQPIKSMPEKQKRTTSTLLPECKKALKIYLEKGQKKHHQHDYIWPFQEKVLRIGVMLETVNRAIRLFDTLLREFQQRKWVYELPSTSDNQVNTVIINDERVNFVLKEMRKQEKIKTDDSWRQYKFIFHSTGNVRIQFGRNGYMYSEIKDTKSIRLEEKIQHIADVFLGVSDSIKQSRQDRIDREHQENLRSMLSSLVKDAIEYNQSCESDISDICKQHERSLKIKNLAQHLYGSWTEKALSSEEKLWLVYLNQKGNESDPANKRDTISLNVPVDIKDFVKKAIQKENNRYKELLVLDLEYEINKILDWELRFGKYK